jgi:hypothetical protein
MTELAVADVTSAKNRTQSINTGYKKKQPTDTTNKLSRFYNRGTDKHY